ncbi:hypothetical protein MMC18_003862 [Xylographa bjoerkii]|nr:hypothetical protein [Xylographa bjoerkii]
MLHQKPPPARASSPDNLPEEDRKRKRKALSCYDCRRSKVRCDRRFPSCGRCAKQGHANSCIYEAAPLDAAPEGEVPASNDWTTFGPVRTSDGGSSRLSFLPTSTKTREAAYDVSSKRSCQIGRIEQLEARINSLEATAKQGTERSNGFRRGEHVTDSMIPPESSMVNGAQSGHYRPASTETMLFRGMGFKGQFYGASNPTSLISHFPELRTFMKDLTTSTTLKRAHCDTKNPFEKPKCKQKTVPTSAVESLVELLPQGEVMDDLVQRYFDTLETTFRVLHRVSFMKDYVILRDNPMRSKPEFVVILLLLMATVYCNSERANSDQTHDRRETSLVWVQACEAWLQGRGWKRLRIAFFQINCLLFIAKQINGIKIKQAWTASGTLLRYGISAGLHRNPNLREAETSPMDREMMRRLWATMVELELQSSIDRGMQPSSAGLFSDCGAPLNINDGDVWEGCEQYPLSKPVQDFTATSFLHISQHSLRLRQSLTSLINNPNTRLRFEEVLSYEHEIMQALEAIPQWTNYDESSPDVLAPSSLPQTLLDIQLRQFLILLHGPFTRMSGAGSRYGYSRAVSFNAASDILESHRKLVTSKNYFLCLLRNDIFSCALSICHTMFLSGVSGRDMFSSMLCTSFPQITEVALSMLEVKLVLLARVDISYWFVSAAYGITQAKIASTEPDAQIQPSRDRIARLYNKILASQQNSNGRRTPDQSSIADDLDPGTVPVIRLLAAPISESLLQNTFQPFEAFDHLDMSEWNFDGPWPFDPIEL